MAPRSKTMESALQNPFFVTTQEKRFAGNSLFKIVKTEAAVWCKYDVRVKRYPLTEHDDRRHSIRRIDACQMDVAVNKGSDFRMSGKIVTGKVHQSAGGSLRDCLLLIGVAVGTVLVRPTRGNGIGPAWMDSSIQPLAYRIVETPARETVHCRLATHIVTMGDKNKPPVNVHYGMPLEHRHVQLISQVVKKPHVMVARHPSQLHT